jgi:catechol 2,3-dioxygenase-like lactoylglutathione lyase family enzyme
MSNLTYISPSFIVSRLKDSVSFYVDKLGFEVLFTGPDDDPYWAIVGRDNISIFLKGNTADEGIKPAPNHTGYRFGRWDAYISTADPDTLFEEYTLSGVTFNQSLKVDDDGLLGFEVIDADGYILFFGRPNV